MKITDNPIIIKELQTRLRNRIFLIQQLLYLIVLLISTLILFANSTNYYRQPYQSAGKQFFIIITFIQLAVTAIYAAMSGVTSIILEKEEKTFDLLLITPLKPFDIVIGKTLGPTIGYILFLFAGLPFLFIAMTAGGFSSIDIVISLLILCLFIFMISLLGALYSTISEKLISAIAGLVICLFFYGMFLFVSTFAFLYRYLNNWTSQKIPFAMVFNPMTAIVSFLSGSMTCKVFGFNLNLSTGFLFFALTLIIMLVWGCSNIIRNYNDNSRIMTPFLYMFSCYSVFIFTILTFWDEINRHRFKGDENTMILLFFIIIFIPLFIDRHDYNFKNNRSKIINRFYNFAAARQIIFILSVIMSILIGIIFLGIYLSPGLRFNKINYSEFIPQLIVILFFIPFYSYISEYWSYRVTKKKFAVLLTYITLGLFLFTTNLPVIGIQPGDASVCVASVNPILSILLIDNPREFHNKVMGRTGLTITACIFYIAVTLILRKYLKLYRWKKKTEQD